MKNVRSILTAPLLFVTLSIFASATQAQALRTFVSTDGKDSNSCVSLDKPYRTISVDGAFTDLFAAK